MNFAIKRSYLNRAVHLQSSSFSIQNSSFQSKVHHFRYKIHHFKSKYLTLFFNIRKFTMLESSAPICAGPLFFRPPGAFDSSIPGIAKKESAIVSIENHIVSIENHITIFQGQFHTISAVLLKDSNAKWHFYSSTQVSRPRIRDKPVHVITSNSTFLNAKFIIAHAKFIILAHNIITQKLKHHSISRLLDVCIEVIISNTEFISFNAEFISFNECKSLPARHCASRPPANSTIVMQNSSFSMQMSSCLMQNSSFSIQADLSPRPSQQQYP